MFYITLYQFGGCLEFLLAIWMPLLETAGIARAIAAVRGSFFLPHILIFFLEKVWGYSGINMLPGQCLVQGAFSVGVEGRVESAFVEGMQPVVVVKTFMPGIKSAAQFPGLVDNLSQPAVTAGHDCFKLTGFGVLP